MTKLGEASPAVTASRPPAVATGLMPLAVDVAIPIGIYYVAHYALGADLVTSLIISSVVPAVRSVVGAVRDRTLNGLALLMVTVNVAGIVASFVSGDARILFAKDSGIGSVVALGILASVFRGRPLMSEGLKPFVIKGDAARATAWDHLTATSTQFRSLERRFTAVWGVALLTDCVARFVCASTVPVPVLSWLSGVLLIGAIGVAMVLGGGWAAPPIVAMIEHEAEIAGRRDLAMNGLPPGTACGGR